jgi:predicted nucleotidyltransferase
MKQINTLSIENFLEKARIAVKSNQKQIVLDIKEAQALYDSIALVMTRLTGKLDAEINKPVEETVIQVAMDGGGFKE